MSAPGDLLSVKELAAGLRRSRFYVHAAKKQMLAAGVEWPTNRCSMETFLEWLKASKFRSTNYGKGKK